MSYSCAYADHAVSYGDGRIFRPSHVAIMQVVAARVCFPALLEAQSLLGAGDTVGVKAAKEMNCKIAELKQRLVTTMGTIAPSSIDCNAVA